MTNEEIIALIQYDICLGCDYKYDVSNYECKRCHFGAAIAALKAEPCEDAVKRDAVLNTLEVMDKALDEDRTVEAYKELLKECYRALPPVTPKQKTGHWIKMPLIETGQSYSHECSECGRKIMAAKKNLSEFPYCHCGAKMEGESE